MTLRLWTADALRAHKFERPMFLCDPLAPTGGIVLLHGPSESGKTQLVMTLIKAVLEGGLFLGQFPCRSGRVLLLEADTPMLLIQERLRRFPATPAQLAGFNILADETKAFNILTQSISPQSDMVAAQAFDPDLVVFDSLRDLHGLDENDSTSPKLVYGAIKRLFPRPTAIVIAHDRKKSTAGIRHPDEETSGHGAWRNASDISWHLERYYNHKEPFEHYATLRSSKTRWSEKIPPIRLKMDYETLLMTATEMSPEQLVMTWVRENPELSERAVVDRLLGGQKCSRATAYRLAKKVLSHAARRLE